MQVLDAEPALRIERCGLGGFGRDGQGQLQRLFVAFQLGQAVLAKRRHKDPRRHHPAGFLPDQLRRTDGRKAGQDLCPGIRQRAGPGQGGRLVQGAEQRFGTEALNYRLRLKLRREGIGHTLQLVGPPCPQPQHHGGTEGTGGFPLPLCGREPDRFGHAEAAAVLTDALHVQHLIERQVHTLALQGAVPFCPPGAEDVQRPLGHSLGIQDLEVVEGGCPGNVQDGGGRRRKGQLTFHRDELVEHGRAADAL